MQKKGSGEFDRKVYQCPNETIIQNQSLDESNVGVLKKSMTFDFHLGDDGQIPCNANDKMYTSKIDCFNCETITITRVEPRSGGYTYMFSCFMGAIFPYHNRFK